ncbi:MAG: hypothetical protein JWN40_6032 [Phycisphaerales bacterium]|nr:hypothetical protein [Phycisphaerales bacterium]
MLNYHPPKSQLWGHRVGRLSTLELLDRSEQFVREQMIIQTAPNANFTVNWTSTRSLGISESVQSIRQVLLAQPVAGTASNKYRERLQSLTWKLTTEEMRAAAVWLDAMAGQHQEDEFSGTLSRTLTFRWSSVPGGEPARCGGMFAVYLPRPGALTTMFGFVSMEHYQAIKDYLAQIGLVVLSDRHLRAARPAKAAKLTTLPK